MQHLFSKQTLLSITLPLIGIAAPSIASAQSIVAEPSSAPPQLAAPSAPIATAPHAGNAAHSAAAESAQSQTSFAGIACTLGEHSGVEEADARTSAELVCGDVATRIAQSGGSASGYRVGLGKLGNKIILSLAATDASGGAVDARRIELGSIEDVTAGSKRVVTALFERRSVADVATTENIVSSERRGLATRSGRVHFDLGVVGGKTLTSSGAIGAGLQMGFSYEGSGSRLSPVVDFRFTTKDDVFVAAGAGVRYFLSPEDISPFVGGGLAWSYNEIKSDGVSGGGFGAYAETGVEFLRTSSTHFRLGLRADAPFYAATTPAADLPTSTIAPSAAGGASSYTPAKPPSPPSRYALPLSLAASFVF